MGSWWQSKKDTVEDRLSIDIRHWVKLGHGLQEGVMPTYSTQGVRIGGYYDLSHLTLDYWYAGQRIEQSIMLDHTQCHFGGTRAWFLCPGCSERRAKLHFGDRGYRCRNCYNLSYQSEESGDIDRLILKKRKIDQRLNKPRIRRATRVKLNAQSQSVKSRIEDGMQARFG